MLLWYTIFDYVEAYIRLISFILKKNIQNNIFDKRYSNNVHFHTVRFLKKAALYRLENMMNFYRQEQISKH